MRRTVPLFLFFVLSLQANALGNMPIGVSSKALSLSKAAEEEFAKRNNAGVEKGIVLLESAVVDISFKRLPLDIQLPIFLRLAHNYAIQGAHQQQEKLLLALIENSNFEPFQVQLKTSLAISYMQQARLLEAETIFKALSKLDPKVLPQQDRNEIASLREKLERYYERLLITAEKQLAMKEYENAISSYSIVYRAMHHGSFPKSTSRQMKQEFSVKIRHQLGVCSLCTHDYSNAVTILRKQPDPRYAAPEVKQMATDSLLLLGKALRRQHLHQEAIDALQHYLTQEKKYLRFAESAHFEAALSAYALHDMTQAAEHLQAISPQRPQVKLLSAKIAIETDRDADAEKLLDELSRSEVALESLFVKGKLFLKQGNDEDAMLAFEQSILDGRMTPWKEEALLHLGNGYLRLVKANGQEQWAYIERSDACLKQLHNEAAFLTLAKSYFWRYLTFGEFDAKKQLEHHLQMDCHFLSKTGREEAELLQALVAPTHEEKKEQLARHSSSRAHYLLAINAIQTKNYDEAFLELQKVDHLEIPVIELAKAYLTIPHANAAARAAALLEPLADDEEAAFQLLRAKGTIASAHDFLLKYPQSNHQPFARHLLATFYIAEKKQQLAQNELVQHLKDFPEYPERAHVLFLAALGYDDTEFEKARHFRKELVMNFPASPYAAEAFFREFPESEYRHGSPKAILHLQEMCSLFPESPYSIAAHFYVGNFLMTKEKERERENALTHFQQADHLYESYTQTSSKNDELSRYLRTIQMEALLAQGSCQDAVSLKKLVAIVEKEIQLGCTKRLLSLYQEATYLLASNCDDALHRKQLLSLIQWHRDSGLKGKFLTKAFLDLAVKEQKIGNYATALEELQQAEQTGTKELMLDIWIAKSSCYRDMGKLDAAMGLLSKVINDDTASQLRIKAMLLRAEIYEQQERYDLAIKQLEAAANKGGEWGLAAHKKLEEKYGYQ